MHINIKRGMCKACKITVLHCVTILSPSLSWLLNAHVVGLPVGSTPGPTREIRGEIQGDRWFSLPEGRGKILALFYDQSLGGGDIHKFEKDITGIVS